MAVLLEAAVVKAGAETDDADFGGLELPVGVEAFFSGVYVGGPESPTHFELVGGIVVEFGGGLGDGAFDDGTGGVRSVGGAAVVDVNPLICGRFSPVDGVGACRVNPGEGALGLAVRGDQSELTEHTGEGCGQGFETEIRVPETEVKLVGHSSILGEEAAASEKIERSEIAAKAVLSRNSCVNRVHLWHFEAAFVCFNAV